MQPSPHRVVPFSYALITPEDITMSHTIKKTDLTPVEALLIERALGEEARVDSQSGTLARIQQLTAERGQLFSQSAANPLLGPTYGARIRELSGEIDRLWVHLRRERATRRAELERVLNVVPEDEEPDMSAAKSSGSSDAA
jgi:hypothetical protein